MMNHRTQGCAERAYETEPCTPATAWAAEQNERIGRKIAARTGATRLHERQTKKSPLL